MTRLLVWPRLDASLEQRRAFWTEYQPGFRFTDAEVGMREFFQAVERHRYALESHIPEVVQFPAWAGTDVLEAGCGIATDGLQFARAGARYTGIDLSPTAVDLARRRFELAEVEGSFVQGSITELPFPDASFDLVYSHGVIHHVPETERVVGEERDDGRVRERVVHDLAAAMDEEADALGDHVETLSEAFARRVLL